MTAPIVLTIERREMFGGAVAYFIAWDGRVPSSPKRYATKAGAIRTARTIAKAANFTFQP